MAQPLDEVDSSLVVSEADLAADLEVVAQAAVSVDSAEEVSVVVAPEEVGN